jgi:HEAT repeat protein
LLTILGLVPLSAAAAPAELTADEQLLKDFGVVPDGPGVLKFLRTRTPADNTIRQNDARNGLRARGADRDRIHSLIAALGDRRFFAREQAATELLAIGPLALRALHSATLDGEVEVRLRAEACIHAIETHPGPDLVAAAVRVLRHRSPPGAIAAVLAYAPFAENDAVVEELLQTLVDVGVHEGKADGALLAGLQAPNPERRAAAGFAVSHATLPEHRAAARRLLTDEAAIVRLRTAEGLLLGRDTAGLPALVGLLTEDRSLALEAEQVLGRVAGERAPRVVLGDSLVMQKRCRDAWEVWCRNNKDHVDKTHLPDAVVLNPERQARAAVERFVEAMVSAGEERQELVRKTVELPFCNLAGNQIVRTAKGLDKVIEECLLDPGDDTVLFNTTTAMPLAAYLPQVARAPRALLSKFPCAEIWVVGLQVQLDEETSVECLVFVHVSKKQARVVGFSTNAEKLEK